MATDLPGANEMNVDHTPPPWTFDLGDDGDDSVGLGPTVPTVYHETPDGDVVPICTLALPAYRTDDPPENEWDEGLRAVGNLRDNGRLIGAAPALLVALREAEALIAKNTYPCPDKPKSAWGILTRVREALALADGTRDAEKSR